MKCSRRERRGVFRGLAAIHHRCVCFRATLSMALLWAVFLCGYTTAETAPPRQGKSVAEALAYAEGALARGTEWETRYYAVDSGRPGPTVMIVGGVHGNEPAGARAADQIRNWKIRRGKLIVIPRSNVRALENRSRLTPSVAEAERNLNRNFPVGPDDLPRGRLAAALWAFVRETRPDWLLDLHEGYGFGRTSASVGSSIISSDFAASKAAARRMLGAVNATIDDEIKEFLFKCPPTTGSLARAAADVLQIPSLILETTYKEQPLSLRVRQHRIMVGRFLADLEMYSGDVDALVHRTRARDCIHAAIYDAGGSLNSPGPSALETVLAGQPDIDLHRIGLPEIRRGVLKQFDVVIFAGGSGSGQSRALGREGVQAVRDYVKQGGGYVGLCAGAYLATSDYSWSLKILDAKTVDRKHWKRGTGTVKIDITQDGQRLLGHRDGLVEIKYANGPLLAPSELPEIPDFQTLALFRTEIARNGAPTGVMIDTPAMVAGRYGKGRVFCSSPHPEYTPGLEELVRRAVRWAAGR